MQTLILIVNKIPCLKQLAQAVLRFAERLHQLVLRLCWQLFVRLPIHERKVIFCNFYGGGFGDNPPVHRGGDDPPEPGL